MGTKIRNRDLRRALLFYLIGFGVYLSTWVLSVGNLASGVAADPGTTGSVSTDRWVCGMLTVAAFSIIVSSQVWYLRTKNARGKGRSVGNLIREVRVEMLLLAWVVLAILSFVLSTVMGEAAPPPVRLPVLSVQLAFVGTPLYYLAIVSWNVKRLVDTWSPSHRKAVSLIIGLVSAVLLLPILYSISLAVIKALQFASIVP